MLVTRKAWICDICGTEHADEDRATKCEAAGKKGLPDSPSWHWYRLKSGGTEIDVFGYRVARRDRGCCLQRHIEIHSYQSNSYYRAPADWEILEILSPMEMAAKYGKLPSVFFNDDPGRPMHRPEPPEDVKAELERVFEWYRRYEIDRLCRARKPEELARMYLEAKHPHLNLF